MKRTSRIDEEGLKILNIPLTMQKISTRWRIKSSDARWDRQKNKFYYYKIYNKLVIDWFYDEVV